ncbi:hypothetical protein CY35_18G094400 [Sphagnum magellanicum]|nr:hypothetical protein CY35_18G094400 [Sphagnum magellanicum]
MTTTRQQESRVMQSGICDDVFFLFSLENPPLFCSELQQGTKGIPDFMDKDDESVPCRRGLKTCSLPEVITGNLKGGRRRRRLWSCMRNSQKQL